MEIMEEENRKNRPNRERSPQDPKFNLDNVLGVPNMKNDETRVFTFGSEWSPTRTKKKLKTGQIVQTHEPDELVR